MKKGVIQQRASPHTIYTRPYNIFVSTFIGHSNLFKGHIEADGAGKTVVFADGFRLPMTTLSEEAADGQEVVAVVRATDFPAGVHNGDAVHFSFAPECVHLFHKDTEENLL